MTEPHVPLSRYFLSDHHRALAGADLPVRLALALGAVRSVIRVIDNTVPPMQVEWASVDDAKGFSSSYTDIKGHRIAINPLPFTEKKLDYGHALDVCTGFALHEAGHSQHSRDAFRVLIDRKEIHDPKFPHTDPETVYSRTSGKPTREVARFRPLRIAGYLLNLAEDVRTEGVTAKEWPGFADYFPLVKDFMWTGRKPDSYGPDVASKMQLVYLACRYPERLLPGFLDPALDTEVAWWQAWQGDYLSGTATAEETIERGLAHLALDEKTRDEMREMSEGERRAEEAGESLRKQIERLMREGIEGAPDVCIVDHHETVPLDAATAAAVDALVGEELVEVKSKIMPRMGSGITLPAIRIRKPAETGQSKRAYVGRPDARAQALRAALVFRPTAAEHTTKLLDRGAMDDEELWRFAAGDYRLFNERNVETRPDVFMGLLVDLSGSMNGEKLRTAQRLAQLFAWALHDQTGIRTEVWGHTADRPTGVDIFRIWEQGDPLSRLGVIATTYHGNNADGFALEWCARRTLEQPEPQKALIVLSDGQPSAYGYDGPEAMRHVRQVSDWSEKHGCPVIQIAIDPYGLDVAEQQVMFKNVIPYRDEAALPKQLAALMARVTS